MKLFTVFPLASDLLLLVLKGVLYYPPDKDAYLRESSVTDQLDVLYKPKKIIENLISDLLETTEENKEKIRELELAMRFVKVLSDMECVEKQG